MEKIKNEELLAHLNWRYAVKKFDVTKKISDADWATLEEALRLSASSSGLQPWNFIVVKNQEMKKKLTPASYNQAQLESCSHVVVFTHAKKISEAYVDKYIKRIASVRGVSEGDLQGFRNSMVGSVVNGPVSKMIESWTARQTYIALGTLLTSAAMLQIDACPMEGIEPAKYDEILDLTNTNYKSVAIVCLGYRSAEDQYQHAKKVRFDKADVIKTI